ncbi:MAG: CcoQ/FixQ family Cbb3-type cytochrome c oxidase assembly chaperone [Flavobacteriales bacterium]
MLKFIKHHLTSIDGIEIYPMISLSIFVLFFAVLIYRVIRTDKKKIEEISNYPLQ